jgi:ABC-type transport system involved in multi-copper enzyme maturation permease subunit
MVVPLIQRELRVRSRQPLTYWSRTVMAIVAAIIALQSSLFSATAFGTTQAGTATFTILSSLAFLFASLAAFATCDSISGERREGTLGLLFLTDLRSHDVILAKLFAAGLTTFYTLIGFVPAFSLAILSGGVSGGMVFRIVWASLNMAFFSLSLGLCVSTCVQTQQRGLRLTVGFLLGWMLLPWVGAYLFSSPFSLLSPYTPFQLAFDGFYKVEPARYWRALIVSHAESWLLLISASILMQRNWRSFERLAPPAQDTIRRLTVGRQAHQAERADWLNRAPIRWIVTRSPGKRFLIWAAVALMFFSGSLSSFPRSLIPGVVGTALSLVMVPAFSGMFAALAARFFFQSKRTGELELLLSTPLGAKDIIEGHWWALWGQLRGPLLLVAFLALVQSIFLNLGGGPVFYMAMRIASQILDVVCVCWLAMWFGLKARNFTGVIAWTLILVIGLPYALWLLFFVLSWLPFGPMAFLLFSPLGWPALNIIKDIALIRWAAKKLRLELRAHAPLEIGQWIE